MNTLFRESFDTDLSALSDAGLLRRIKKVIEQVEAARTFQQIPSILCVIITSADHARRNGLPVWRLAQGGFNTS